MCLRFRLFFCSLPDSAAGWQKPTAKEVAAASTEPVVEALPNLHLLALKFKLGLSTDLVPDAQRAQYKEELLGAIKAGGLAPT